MDLSAKLQLKVDQGIESVSVPETLAASLKDLTADASGATDAALIVFVSDRATLENRRKKIADAASKDRLTWVAYPKSGQLGTDLNRDTLAALLGESDIQPVRQIAIDDVWSALRFRPA